MSFPLDGAPEDLRKLMADIGPRWAQDRERSLNTAGSVSPKLASPSVSSNEKRSRIYAYRGAGRSGYIRHSCRSGLQHAESDAFKRGIPERQDGQIAGDSAQHAHVDR